MFYRYFYYIPAISYRKERCFIAYDEDPITKALTCRLKRSPIDIPTISLPYPIGKNDVPLRMRNTPLLKRYPVEESEILSISMSFPTIIGNV